MSEINVYCDESCHLENDGYGLMVLGAIWCQKEKIKQVSDTVAAIKIKHGLKSYTELKWTKVSSTKIEMYLELVDYFFDEGGLHFRGLVAKDKGNLNHQAHAQTHDEWYYKMYYQLIKTILSSESTYNIFIDHKDTLGNIKLLKMREVLSNSIYDFDRNIIRSAHIISSDSSTCLQLADFFSGILGYVNRGLESSETKKKIVERVREKSGRSLVVSTLPSEDKFNVFIWTPQRL